MWLRVNRNHHTRDEWLALLETAEMNGFTHDAYPDAIRLASPAPVQALPGFEQGWVTVQDASAQGCMTYLEPQNGDRILDLCAAPGGKTTHILEVAPKASVMAVDIDKQRLSRVYDNLKRLGMKAEVKQGDGRTALHNGAGMNSLIVFWLMPPALQPALFADIQTSNGYAGIVILTNWRNFKAKSLTPFGRILSLAVHWFTQLALSFRKKIANRLLHS